MDVKTKKCLAIGRTGTNDINNFDSNAFVFSYILLPPGKQWKWSCSTYKDTGVCSVYIIEFTFVIPGWENMYFHTALNYKQCWKVFKWHYFKDSHTHCYRSVITKTKFRDILFTLALAVRVRLSYSWTTMYTCLKVQFLENSGTKMLLMFYNI
jgi:hypothetical protein